ncbi:MAG: hypothetical protein HY077_05695 [Elusimicrobia bacterium]|nr:hypothetical protein [Elusimicrobiota bacterium]
MTPWAAALILCLGLSTRTLAAEAAGPAKGPDSDSKVKIKPKKSPSDGPIEGGGLLAPDVDLIDAPTSAVLDYGGYSSRTRFFSRGGMLQYVSFGVYQGLNIGGSLTIDSLIGSGTVVRARAPNAQVKWRFYDGDHWLPSLALGYDGQGYIYNSTSRRYNNRQRGFYVVATQELGLPGLQAHPSLNISDFDGNAFFASLPFSYDIKDKVLLMLEWDNIQNFLDSRLNAGFRVFITSHFAADFSVRAIGQGGTFSSGDSRGPERIVQLRYSANF